MNLDEAFRGFSCPYPGPDPGLLDMVAAEHAREVTRRFLQGHEALLQRDGPELGRWLAGWLQQDTGFPAVWDLAFAGLEDAMTPSFGGDPLGRAAEVALALHLAGAPGRWQARLGSPARLRLGRWLLPGCREVAAAADGRTLALRLVSAEGATDVLLGRSAESWQADGVESLPCFAMDGRQVPFVVRPALGGRAPSDGFAAAPLEDVPPELARRCEAAVDLLQKYAPEYLGWVAGVVRSVIPLEAPAGLMLSGSSPRLCGALQLALLVEPVQLAEMLVHESSHQYFYFLGRLGDVDDGSDPTLYYSPIKKTGRPIRFILLAYHAFANVLIFYRLCRAQGLDDGGYCARNEERLAPRLVELEKALRTTRALTAIGRGLWEPLAERLQESG